MPDRQMPVLLALGVRIALHYSLEGDRPDIWAPLQSISTFRYETDDILEREDRPKGNALKITVIWILNRKCTRVLSDHTRKDCQDSTSPV